MPFEPQHVLSCLKSNGLQSVWLIQRPGQLRRTLKTWPLDAVMRAKLLAGIAQPQRQIRGVQRLQRAGLPTPAVIGSWRRRTDNGSARVELELEFVVGSPVWELVKPGRSTPAPDAQVVRAVAAALGRMVSQMAGRRVFHRDLKLSNIVLEQDGGAAPSLWIIDAVGVRVMRRFVPELERMLERLAVQPLDLPKDLHHSARMAVLHGSLRPFSKRRRRAVLKRLRSRA